jgi:hypothetical protein
MWTACPGGCRPESPTEERRNQGEEYSSTDTHSILCFVTKLPHNYSPIASVITEVKQSHHSFVHQAGRAQCAPW